MSMLVYPLVQISIGIIKLVPSSRHHPLRFHLLTSLLRLSSKTQIYIPLLPHLLSVLSSPELISSSNNNKKTTLKLKPLDFTYYLRCPNPYLKTALYAQGLLEETVWLLTEFYSCWSHEVGFPEMAVPGIGGLRRFKKGYRGRGGEGITLLLTKLEDNRKWVEGWRDGMDFKVAIKGSKKQDGESPLEKWERTIRKTRDRRELERTAMEEDAEDDE